jgi:hypothetical protein
VKHRLRIALFSILTLLLMVGPVLAGDPQPADGQSEIEKRGEVVASGQDGVGERTEARINEFNQLVSAVVTTDGKDATSAKEASEAAAQAIQHEVTNRAADGTDATAPNAWYISTQLFRSGSYVYGRGWTEAYPSVYYLRSGNYLCRNGSCTSWTYTGGYWKNWVWAGWSWYSGYTYWYTRSQHYYSTYYASYYYYTANSGYR